MATITQRGTGFQLRVTSKKLPKAFYATFDTREEAESYGQQLEALLARGIVPRELLSQPKAPDDLLLTQVISAYCAGCPALTASDDALLTVVMGDKPIVGTRLSRVSYQWLEQYVAWLKSAKMNLAPSSIRKRIGALGRVMAWHLRSTGSEKANIFGLLPRGYSSYTKADAALAPPKFDIKRDRRLLPDEAARIEAALAGVKREDRERPFTTDAAFALLYYLIVDTGLRLLEAYRLRVDSIDFEKAVARVEGSKGHRGAIKPRVVPIKPALLEKLRAWCDGRVGLIFPYWDGTEEGKRRASNKLSHRFTGLFDYAQVPGFTEHDLRHEAACRWFEMRTASGGWVFSDIHVCRIMGWEDPRMALRYASLRGEDLAKMMG